MTYLVDEESRRIIRVLKEENEQLKRDIEYLAAERGIAKKRAEKLEERVDVISRLYEAEANEADDLAREVSRLNKILEKNNNKEV